MSIQTLRVVTWCYTVVLVLAIGFAWFEDIIWRNDNVDHMLPDVILIIVTVPLSLGAIFLGAMFKWQFAQLTCVSLCGVLQAAGLWYDYGKNSHR